LLQRGTSGSGYSIKEDSVLVQVIAIMCTWFASRTF
jgi:hypothetical protein